MNNKNSNWKWTAVLIAAATAAAAVPASAQDVTLNAIIPFAFSIGKNVKLGPGKYVVTREHNVWRFQSEDRHDIAAMVNFSGLRAKAEDHPALTFECLGKHCQLRTIQVGGGELGAQVSAPKLTKSDAQEVAVVQVPLELNKGD